MPSCRYCFQDSADRIAEFQVIACETDNQAQSRANRMLAAFGYSDIEVWACERKVYSVRKTDALPFPGWCAGDD